MKGKKKGIETRAVHCTYKTISHLYINFKIWSMFTRGDAFNANVVTAEEEKSNLGTVPRRRGSYSVACRRALAKALKVASII